MPEGATYRERLWAPFIWWFVAAAATFSAWLTTIAALPASLAWGLTGFAAAVFAVGLTSYGAGRVAVRDGRFEAGRARIDVRFLGEAEVLDGPAMRSVAGPLADVRAYLFLRPYVRGGVRVGINDPEDPTPYWLVSSRRPESLAKALNSPCEPHPVIGPE